MDYQLSAYQLTCSNLKSFSNCPDSSENVTGPGCFCTNDYVLQGGMCIDAASCPGESWVPTFIHTFTSSTNKYQIYQLYSCYHLVGQEWEVWY